MQSLFFHILWHIYRWYIRRWWSPGPKSCLPLARLILILILEQLISSSCFEDKLESVFRFGQNTSSLGYEDGTIMLSAHDQISISILWVLRRNLHDFHCDLQENEKGKDKQVYILSNFRARGVAFLYRLQCVHHASLLGFQEGNRTRRSWKLISAHLAKAKISKMTSLGMPKNTTEFAYESLGS